MSIDMAIFFAQKYQSNLPLIPPPPHTHTLLKKPLDRKYKCSENEFQNIVEVENTTMLKCIVNMNS